MGFIDFTNGEVLTADQMDTVMRQGIMRFADASARDTALSAVLAEGMMAYLDDTDEVLKYDGSQWIDISGDISGVTAGTALTGGGTSGNVTLDVDTAAVGTAIGIDTKQDNVITTQGDLVIGDASGDPVRLPVGSADQVLTSDGTTVSFQDAGGGGGFNTITEVTASNATYDVSGITGFARITLVGGGAGGSEQNNAGSGGGDTQITISATTTTAQGGDPGFNDNFSRFASDNGGYSKENTSNNGDSGYGGKVKTIYADLTSLSTVNIVIGSGGAGATGAYAGGDGIVLLEYAV